MKKLILFLLCMMFVSGCIAQEELLQVEDISDMNLYVDEDYNVSFNYPSNWIVVFVDEDLGSLLQKEGELSMDRLDEGSLIFKIIDNPGRITLKDYLDKIYDDCLAGVESAMNLIDRVCLYMDIEKWDKMEVSGYPAYFSERMGVEGIPELAKYLYVVVSNDENNYFVYLSSVSLDYYYSRNEDFIEGIFDNAVGSLKIE